MLWLTWFALALGCGNAVERKVVGWSEDGSKALVRVEHPNDDGEIHTLKLVLLHGHDRTEWDILTLEDESSPKIRAERWKSAEADLKELGIRIDPDRAPIGEGTKPIRWNDLDVSVFSYAYQDTTQRRWLLMAQRGDERRMVRRLAETSNSTMSFGIGTWWTDPENTHLVVLPSHGMPLYRLIPLTEVNAAFDRPKPDCPKDPERRVVGWAPDGSSLVRVEQQDCRVTLIHLSAGTQRTFEILKPGEDPSVRDERWTTAWAEIERSGMVLDPEAKPLMGSVGTEENLLNARIAIPDKGYSLIVEPLQTGDQVRYSLTVHKDRNQTHVTELFDLEVAPYPYAVGSVWVNPNRTQVVFLPSYGHAEYLQIELSDVDKVLAGSPN